MMMNVANRGCLVMRFATALSVIVVLGIASSASAIFTENFDSMTGGTVDTQNGWQSGTSGGGNGIGFIGGGHESPALPSMNLNSTGGPDGSQAANGSHNGGFGISNARDITGDKASDGSWQATFDAFVDPGNGLKFAIGRSDSILQSNVAHELHWLGLRPCPSATVGCEGGTRGIFEASTFIAANDADGGGTGGPNSAGNNNSNQADAGIDITSTWVSVLLQTDTSGVLTWSHKAMGGPTWLDPQSTPIALTGGAADVQVFQFDLTAGRVDNFVSGVPEPSSLTLVALGSLMMLLRRRRRA